jgi:hypothetical protein
MGRLLVEHLESRHLDLTKHKVWLSEEELTCTFPLYTLLGQLVGYQQYRPDKPKFVDNCPRDSKYFTYWNKRSWVPWGLELLHPSTEVIFLTEGIFDACRLTRRGQVALACLTNHPPEDFKNFLSFFTARVVTVLDDDKAGLELLRFGNYSEVVPNGDLGDAQEDYVSFLVNKYT